MEKTTKKRSGKRGILTVVAACGVAAALVVGLAPGVRAAGNASLPPETGNLHIHKYASDDFSAIGAANDGTEAQVDASFQPAEGVVFDIYKVVAHEDGDYPGDGPYRLTTSTSEEAGSIIEVAVLTDGAGEEFGIESASTASVTTGADGQATASGLVQGVYLVVEEENEGIAEPAEPFTVAVPMTDASGSGWLSDVHVYPKNQTMYVNKYLAHSTADNEAAGTQTGHAVNVGDTVHYSVSATVPDGVIAYAKNADNTPKVPTETTAEDAKVKYAITDAFDTALTFDAASGVSGVYGWGLDSTGAEVWNLINSSFYEVALDASNVAKVEFTAAGRLALYEAGYSKVRVDFDVTVNDGMLSKEKTKIENTAYVKFTNKFGTEKSYDSSTDFDPDDPHDDDPKVPVHTGHISVVKKDATSGNVLSGAKFKIADNEADAKAGKYLRKTAEGAIVDPADARWATATDWEATSADDGTFSFDGVEDFTSTIDADGNETKEYCAYWLVETQAPSGYNLPASPVKVQFSAENSTEAVNWTVEGTVTNTNDFTLPLTGGPGQALLVLAGLAFTAAAAVLVTAASRRKKAVQE